MGGDKIPENHIKVFPLCEECHTDQFWKPLVRMDHDVVIGSCFSCHDGITATGKTPDHIASNNSCDDCHTTIRGCRRLRSRQRHPAPASPATTAPPPSASQPTISPANSCDDCHTTNAWTRCDVRPQQRHRQLRQLPQRHRATGKNANPYPDQQSARTATATNGWIPVALDHANVIGTCSTCHNGTTATGKTRPISPAQHLRGLPHHQYLDPARCSITASVTGTCVSCHNGTTATGKTANHIASNNTAMTATPPTAGSRRPFDHSHASPATAPAATTAPPPPARTATHIQTTNLCEDCHSTSSWTPVTRVDHAAVTRHLLQLSQRHHRHRQDSQPYRQQQHCDDCHTTNGWIPAPFDHSKSPATAPAATTAPPPPARQHPYPDHGRLRGLPRTNTWTPVTRVDHSDVTRHLLQLPQRHHRRRQVGQPYRQQQQLRRLPHHQWLDPGAPSITARHRQLRQLPQRHHRHRQEHHPYPDHHAVRGLPPHQCLDPGDPGRSRQRLGTCVCCHNGTTATGKTANHIASSNSCDDCHTTNGWIRRRFDHSNVTGNCASCHNGTTATGKNSHPYPDQHHLRGLSPHQRPGPR